MKRMTLLIPILLLALLTNACSDSAPSAPNDDLIAVNPEIGDAVRGDRAQFVRGDKDATVRAQATQPFEWTIPWCDAQQTSCIVNRSLYWTGDAAFNNTTRIRQIKRVAWSFKWLGMTYGTLPAGIIFVYVTDATGASWRFDVSNAPFTRTENGRNGQIDVSGSGIEQWPNEWLLVETRWGLGWDMVPKYLVSSSNQQYWYTEL